MELDELKKKSNTTILLRAKSGRGKTYNAVQIAMLIAREGNDVLYVDTESAGSGTMVSLIEDRDTDYTEEDIETLDYVQADNYQELKDAISRDGGNQDKYDLIVVDTFDHKHSYVLKEVTDAKRDADPDWNEYAVIYSEEKELMEEVGSSKTNIVGTLDPDSGSLKKPKGAQANVHGYFDIVVELTRNDNEWSNRVRNYVNRSSAIGKALPDVPANLAKEIKERIA